LTRPSLQKPEINLKFIQASFQNQRNYQIVPYRRKNNGRTMGSPSGVIARRK